MLYSRNVIDIGVDYSHNVIDIGADKHYADLFSANISHNTCCL